MDLRFRVLMFLATMFLLTEASSQTMPTRQKYLLKTGDVAMLRANSNNAQSYIWYRNNTKIIGATTASLSVDQSGTYKAIAINSTNCPSEATEIEIIAEPTLSADLAIIKKSETREVMNNQTFSYFLNVRNNGPNSATNLNITDVLPENLIFERLEGLQGTANYQPTTRTITWQLPSLAVGNFVQLEVKVKSREPVKVSNTAKVSATEPDPNLDNNTSTDYKQISALHVHNVFTPNGDGKNDTFLIDNLKSFEENELTVINRWGNIVYKTKNYNNEWNGNELNDGTYFYIIKVRNGKLPWIEQKGYVTLLR
jgi:gliding motility-associated-like protein/uncharacterized repeat protein (TIGR01451 family)